MKLFWSGLFVFLLAVPGKAQTAALIEGDYVEARSGHVYTCGCLYSGETVTAGKEAILVWRIAAGTYEGVPLAGIRVAAVVLGETNLGTSTTARRTALYLDGLTSLPQEEAIRALWPREYAPVLGAVSSVRALPIAFDQQGETASIEIRGVARLRVRKARIPEDAHPGSSLWYGPFASLRESALATALHYEYSGLDFPRQWREMLPSISGYVGRFRFSAGL